MIVVLVVLVIVSAAGVAFFMARSLRLSYYRGGNLDEIRKAAAEDIAKLHEDDKYFRGYSPGQDPNDL